MEKVHIYNKGKRTFQTKSGNLKPDATVEVSAEFGAKMHKDYPREIMILTPAQTPAAPPSIPSAPQAKKSVKKS